MCFSLGPAASAYCFLSHFMTRGNKNASTHHLRCVDRHFRSATSSVWVCRTQRMMGTHGGNCSSHLPPLGFTEAEKKNPLYIHHRDIFATTTLQNRWYPWCILTVQAWIMEVVPFCSDFICAHTDVAHKPQQPHNRQNGTANWEPAREEDLKVGTNCRSRVGYTSVLPSIKSPLNGILNLKKKNPKTLEII